MSSHVGIGPGGRLQCNHCGTTHDPFKGAATELWAVSALSTAFARQHAGCPKPKGPRCVFCFALTHASAEHVNVTTRTPGDWIDCGDAGTSSKVIWRHMMGLPPDGRDHPLDPDDFGRCYRLLHAPWATEWRARIWEMSVYGREWSALVNAWPGLEALFEEERTGKTAPKLYAAMQRCRGIEPAPSAPPKKRRTRKPTK